MPTELSGVITDIFQVERYTNFQKRVFWVKQPDSEKFPQHWQVEVQQQQISLLDNYAPGDEVICTINIRGKSWLSKKGEQVVMNTLQCWKLEKTKSGGNKPGRLPLEDEPLPF